MVRYLAWALVLFGISALPTNPAAASPATRHLYVADDIDNQVVEFPIRADGLPSTKPDNVLHLNGGAYGLAVDHAGDLFVSVFQDSSRSGFVEIFPPGAKGSQKPERTLPFAANTDPFYLAVDDNQNLYVDLNNFNINVYALANPTSPIASFSIRYGILEMQLDRSGALYVSEIGQIGVYLQPLVRQTPDGLVLPQGGFEHTIFGSIAIDEVSSKLYFQTTPLIEQRWGEFDFAERALPGYVSNALGKPDPMILSDACIGPGSKGLSYGAAISGRYFLAGCVAYNTNAAVLVYDKDSFGRRPPVEAIGAGYVQSEADLVVGP
jgi:hypothetical protein